MQLEYIKQNNTVLCKSYSNNAKPIPNVDTNGSERALKEGIRNTNQ